MLKRRKQAIKCQKFYHFAALWTLPNCLKLAILHNYKIVEFNWIVMLTLASFTKDNSANFSGESSGVNDTQNQTHHDVFRGHSERKTSYRMSWKSFLLGSEHCHRFLAQIVWGEVREVSATAWCIGLVVVQSWSSLWVYADVVSAKRFRLNLPFFNEIVAYRGLFCVVTLPVASHL